MSDTAMETSLPGKMHGFHFCLRNFVIAFFLNGNGQRTCFLKKKRSRGSSHWLGGTYSISEKIKDLSAAVDSLGLPEQGERGAGGL